VVPVSEFFTLTQQGHKMNGANQHDALYALVVSDRRHVIEPDVLASLMLQFREPQQL
jgi:hypothetical protein